MCYVELEPCQVWRETERVARKRHHCSICGATIQPGARYTEHFSLDEGEPCHAKVCDLCQDARKQFAEVHEGEFGPTYNQPPGFTTVLAECIAEGDEESETLWRPLLDAINARIVLSRSGIS